MVILSQCVYQPSEKNTVTIAVVQQTTSALLLLQRNPDAYPNYVDAFPLFWELIGGGVETGEEPKAAAQREVLEETGIVISALELLGISPFLNNGASANNWIYIALVEKELPVVISREHVGYVWRSLEDALHMQLAFKHSCILEAIIRRRSF